MLRLRHLVIRPFDDASPPNRFDEWVGHLALESEVADLLYDRFGRSFSGNGVGAYQKETLVGICIWRQDEGFGFLGPIVVRPEKRSWGVGSALVSYVIDEMRQEGVRSIEAVYPTENDICAGLFGNRGFRNVGEERVEGCVWTRVERVLKKS